MMMGRIGENVFYGNAKGHCIIFIHPTRVTGKVLRRHGTGGGTKEEEDGTNLMAQEEKRDFLYFPWNKCTIKKKHSFP
jgi:hypothetical protein